MDFNRDVFSLCEENEGLRDFLISKNFANLKNDKLFAGMAKFIKLKDALKMKNIDRDLFLQEYENYLNLSKSSIETVENKNGAEYRVTGLVPCPIRVPFIDSLNVYNKKNNVVSINYDMRSANLGMDFIIDSIMSDNGPDMITSVGYDLMINTDVRKIIERDYYAPEIDFSDEISVRIDGIKDPKKRFHIMAFVPAVFIVNKDALNGRKVPRSWDDLLSSDDFIDSLTIPVGDLDLYNAIVLGIYSKYGEDGLKKLKATVTDSMHPSQMVNPSRDSKACVFVAPYFFASLVNNKNLEVVWPEDGSIVSPIFISIKKGSKDNMDSAISYLFSEEVSEIFSSNGKFPITLKDCKRQFEDWQKLIFVGWDILDNIDEHRPVIEKYFSLGD